jgi:hypothetical protein
MITNFNDPAFLKWSVQRALVGNVTANLAAVHAKLENFQIQIFAYFFDEPNEDDSESIEVAASEVIADFTENYTVETRFGLISDVKLNAIEWNFLRAEAGDPAIRTKALSSAKIPGRVAHP